WKDTIDKGEISERLTQHTMRATMIQCSTSISQVIRAAEILTNFSVDELQNTCVVINDESALEPLLSAITDVKSEVNLAIGKPIQHTHVSRIVEELFVLRSLHVRKGKMYYKPFVQWLQVIRAAGFHAYSCEEIREQIVASNSVQITQEHIREWQQKHVGLADLLGALLIECSSEEAVSLLFDFIESVEPSDDFMKAARSKMLDILGQLNTLLQQSEYMRNDHLLLKIYQLVISRMKLHYEGEPVNGLQLLSISETRALDFERVLFLGANDEYFPGERMEQSFIPFDLRAHYQLPMPEDLDAIHSYTYHRLLHEARDVYYLYSAVVSDSKPGEPSRYITQFLSEVLQANPTIEISEEVVGNSEPLNFKEGVVSSDFIRERIKSLLASGVSPSAINKLISCPLDFYYLYIARLGEEEEVEETLSSSTFGQIVHKVLEDFYRPFIDSYPDGRAFTALKDNLETVVFEAAREMYKGRTISEGIDYLSMRIAIEMLEKYIGFELESLNAITSTSFQRKVTLVEGSLNRVYPEGVGGLPAPFAVKGKIDRGDSVAGVLHVIDYKTGKISSGKSKFKGNFDELFTKKDYSKFLQLLIYIMMTRQRDQPIPTASFYSMREGGGAYVHAQELSELTIDHEFIDKVEEALGRFLHDLLNRSTFEHSSDAKYCQYCFVK
ncbi:MAG: PD-(D/E)XK nuclease family protein, partial [Flavobacteriales bacterium]